MDLRDVLRLRRGCGVCGVCVCFVCVLCRAGPLSDGSVAVILFNRGSMAASITANWRDIGLSPGAAATVRDLWAHNDVGSFTGSFNRSVNSHASFTFKITPSSAAERAAVMRAGLEQVERAQKLREMGFAPPRHNRHTRNNNQNN